MLVEGNDFKIIDYKNRKGTSDKVRSATVRWKLSIRLADISIEKQKYCNKGVMCRRYSTITLKCVQW